MNVLKFIRFDKCYRRATDNCKWINLIGTLNPRKYLTRVIILRRQSGISTKNNIIFTVDFDTSDMQDFHVRRIVGRHRTRETRFERVKSFDILLLCFLLTFFLSSHGRRLEYRKTAIRAEYEKKEETASTLIASNPLKYYFLLVPSHSRSFNLLRTIFIIGSHPDKSD